MGQLRAFAIVRDDRFMDGYEQTRRLEAEAWPQLIGLGDALGPDSFDAMRIPVLRGRGFVDEDRQGSSVVVSEELERRLFGGSAVGQRLILGPGEDVVEVIGVAGNVRQRTPSEDDQAVLYMLNWQVGGIRQLVVRTSGASPDILPLLRDAVTDSAPQLAITSTTTPEQGLAESTWEERFRAQVAAVFGVAALLLAAVGLFGLTHREAIERRREIGVRVALGATPGRISALVMRQAVLALMTGLAIGTPLALAVSHVAESLLFGVSPTDPRLLVTPSGVLCAVAIAATVFPAHRYSRIDPGMTLRE